MEIECPEIEFCKYIEKSDIFELSQPWTIIDFFKVFVEKVQCHGPCNTPVKFEVDPYSHL